MSLPSPDDAALLPPEILAMVFSSLPIADYKHAAATCHSWANVMKFLTTDMFLCDYGAGTRKGFLKKDMKHGSVRSQLIELVSHEIGQPSRCPCSEGTIRSTIRIWYNRYINGIDASGSKLQFVGSRYGNLQSIAVEDCIEIISQSLRIPRLAAIILDELCLITKDFSIGTANDLRNKWFLTNVIKRYNCLYVAGTVGQTDFPTDHLLKIRNRSQTSLTLIDGVYLYVKEIEQMEEFIKKIFWWHDFEPLAKDVMILLMAMTSGTGQSANILADAISSMHFTASKNFAATRLLR